jgi:hypothetical protein
MNHSKPQKHLHENKSTLWSFAQGQGFSTGGGVEQATIVCAKNQMKRRIKINLISSAGFIKMFPKQKPPLQRPIFPMHQTEWQLATQKKEFQAKSTQPK